MEPDTSTVEPQISSFEAALEEVESLLKREARLLAKLDLKQSVRFRILLSCTVFLNKRYTVCWVPVTLGIFKAPQVPSERFFCAVDEEPSEFPHLRRHPHAQTPVGYIDSDKGKILFQIKQTTLTHFLNVLCRTHFEKQLPLGVVTEVFDEQMRLTARSYNNEVLPAGDPPKRRFMDYNPTDRQFVGLISCSDKLRVPVTIDMKPVLQGTAPKVTILVRPEDNTTLHPTALKQQVCNMQGEVSFERVKTLKDWKHSKTDVEQVKALFADLKQLFLECKPLQRKQEAQHLAVPTEDDIPQQAPPPTLSARPHAHSAQSAPNS